MMTDRARWIRIHNETSARFQRMRAFRRMHGSAYVGVFPNAGSPFLPFPIQGPTPGPQTLPPAADVESVSVKRALDFEAQGMAWVPEASAPTHTETSIRPYYERAAQQWANARDAAGQLYLAEGPLSNGKSTVRGENAKFRMEAYEQRRLFDQNVADGKSQRPPSGFQWPAIYQAPEGPPGPVFQPPPPPTPTPDDGQLVPPAAGPSGTVVLVLLALAGVAVYALRKVIRVG